MKCVVANAFGLLSKERALMAQAKPMSRFKQEDIRSHLVKLALCFGCQLRG